MNKKSVQLLLVGLLTATLSRGQDVLSLREAIEFSLKNHKSNVVYGNEIKISRQQAKEALSAYLPQVNGSFSLDNNLKLQSTVFPGALVGQPEDLVVQMGNKFTSSAIVQIDQTIYDQALIYGIKAGVPAKKIAELNDAKNKEELTYNTASAYSQILILKEQQKLLQASEKQNADLFEITKFRLEKGVAKKNDLDRITVQLNNVHSQQKQVETSIQVAYRALKNAMGMDLNANVVINDHLDYTSFMRPPADSLRVRDLIDFQLQEQNLNLKAIDVKRKQAAYLPTIAAYGRNGQQAFGNEFNNAISGWRNFSSIGLKVNIPIFSGQRRSAQLQQSKLEFDNTRENLEINTKNLEIQFQNAQLQLLDNITTLNANKSNMDLAGKVFEVSQFEYSKGVISMSDFLNSDFSYRQAQSDYLVSLANLIKNRIAYERAKGNISGFINQL